MIEALQLGASLYVPATRPDLVSIGNRVKHPNLRSVIFCTEDAICSDDVPQALANLQHALAHFEAGLMSRFVRVRNPTVLRRILQMDGVQKLTGFVFPKATLRNIDDYLTAIPGEHPFRIMIILETADAFDPAEMAALRTRMLDESCRRRILSLRIGGNDLLQFLGMRRPRRRSIYATPLGPVIHQLVATFRPFGFNLTAPVFEWLDCGKLLAREARRDVASGLFGKSAIHPDQVPIIESAYKVGVRELHAAKQILAPNAPPVFRLDGAMCEPATHRAWATLICERAKLFGVRDELNKKKQRVRRELGIADCIMNGTKPEN